MWTQESKAPIVQIGESQASINAHPVGHVVRFSNFPKTYVPELMLPPLTALPMGNARTVAMTKPMFVTIHADWIFGMILAKKVAISP
jgi:hypothetical protein